MKEIILKKNLSIKNYKIYLYKNMLIFIDKHKYIKIIILN